MTVENPTENFREKVKEIEEEIEECWSLIHNLNVKKEIKLEAKAHIISSYEKIIAVSEGKDLEDFIKEFNNDKIVLETLETID